MQEKIQIYINGGVNYTAVHLHRPSIQWRLFWGQVQAFIARQAFTSEQAAKRKYFILLLLHVLYESQIVNFYIFHNKQHINWFILVSNSTKYFCHLMTSLLPRWRTANIRRLVFLYRYMQNHHFEVSSEGPV